MDERRHGCNREIRNKFGDTFMIYNWEARLVFTSGMAEEAIKCHIALSETEESHGMQGITMQTQQ